MTEPTPNDVRMRGFAQRARVEDAWAWIASRVQILDSEIVSLADATGRVLAETVVSPLNVPAFDRSAMDGYAVRAEETDGAADYTPLTLKIIGESLPNQPFMGEVTPGTAVRIMTGAPVPSGADAVLPVEYARERGGQLELTTTVPPGKHIGRVGEDVKAGAELLPNGRRLRPQDVGVLASVGLPDVQAIRRPVVRILITGNELVQPGETRGEHQIFEANSHLLRGLVERDGAVLESVRSLPDSRDAIREGLTEPGADVVLVSGGSSVGKEDHAPSLVQEVGSLDIHGIAMRPSSPAGMGRIDNGFVFLLPGNPVSCLCAYDFFAGRTIRQLGGWIIDWPYTRKTGVLSKKIVSMVGRVDYCRVILQDGQVTPLAVSGASILSSTTRANGFVIVPGEREGYAAGSEVTVFCYD